MAANRLIIVTGKGGTGRSAVAAALALKHAAAGSSVLAISMTESQGLAHHLGSTEISYEPIEVTPGAWTLTIDRRRALDEYVHVQLRLPLRAPLGALTRSLNAVADTVPGIRDAITIGKVAFETWGDRWDVVVADAPPTGQIASYLGAPATIADLVPAGLVRRQAESMRDLLLEESTEIFVTTLAEELPVTETTEAMKHLEEDGFEATVVINRLLAELKADGGSADGPIAEAARLHHALYESQQRWLADLPAGISLPFLFGLHTPSEVSARLAEELP